MLDSRASALKGNKHCWTFLSQKNTNMGLEVENY